MNGSAPAPLLLALQQLLGAERVETDAQALAYFAQDYFRAGEPLLAAIRPGSVEALAAAVAATTAAGFAVYPRGGGLSYSDGYLPVQPGICVDLQDLDAVAEINSDDMYVVVEAGCTWATLDSALAKRGLRVPFFGPMSGLHSTVGGAIAQHAASLGSGLYGTSANSVLGVEIVDAQGRVLRTGSWTESRTPFFRDYGPDLTGLFCGDCGALGIKSRIALRLMARPAEVVGLSFGFDNLDDLIGAGVAVARQGLAADNNSMSAAAVLQAATSQPLREELKTLWQVASNGSGPLTSLARVGRIALSGRRFAAGFAQTSHFVLEGPNRATVQGLVRALRRAVGSRGQEIPNTVPTILRAAPFQEYDMLATTGQRQLPPNTVLPFSQVKAFADAFAATVQEQVGTGNPWNIGAATMFTTLGTTGFLCEPVITWDDAPAAFHERHSSAASLKLAAQFVDAPEARAAVTALRDSFVELAQAHGGTHLQIGKVYPYLAGRDDAFLALVRSIKTELDPQGLMNPGALGLPQA